MSFRIYIIGHHYEAPCLCVVPEEDGCGDSKSEADSEQADEEGAGQRPDFII